MCPQLKMCIKNCYKHHDACTYSFNHVINQIYQMRHIKNRILYLIIFGVEPHSIIATHNVYYEAQMSRDSFSHRASVLRVCDQTGAFISTEN